MSVATNLSAWDDRSLHTLAHFLATHPGLSRLTPEDLAMLGLRSRWQDVEPLAAMPVVLGWIIDGIRSERARAQSEQPVDLVWSGKAERFGSARDISEVLPELFRSAQQRVFVASYVFREASDMLLPLAEQMCKYPLDVKILINTHELGSRDGGGSRDPRFYAKKFLKESWPTAAPVPKLFHFTPTRSQGGSLPVSMHAKCVLIDERYTLIGSANFTRSAQTANLEMGVRVDHPGFARRVWAEWEGLIRREQVQPIDLEALP